MSQLSWQELLDILTQKARDTEILSKLKILNEDILKFQFCYDENK